MPGIIAGSMTRLRLQKLFVRVYPGSCKRRVQTHNVTDLAPGRLHCTTNSHCGDFTPLPRVKLSRCFRVRETQSTPCAIVQEVVWPTCRWWWMLRRGADVWSCARALVPAAWDAWGDRPAQRGPHASTCRVRSRGFGCRTFLVRHYAGASLCPHS